MARSRNIKPGFFKNEALAECLPLSRLLFAGLWCLADRDGRLEDRPKRICAEILPYDGGDIDGMLDELASAGFIVRYEADGGRFIQVVNFSKHQSPHHREQASTIPAPGFPGTGPEQAPGFPKASPEQAHLIPDSLNLIPDSGVPTTSGASAPTGEQRSDHAIGNQTSPDPIFGGCLAFLIGKGCAEKGARSFLGLMRRDYGNAAVVQAVERAEREDISDPLPWLRKALEGQSAPRKHHPQPENLGAINYGVGGKF